MGEGLSHWSNMVLRKSQTYFFDRHTHPNSMYSNFCHVLNRYSELVTLGAICFCLSENDYPIGAVITFAALIGSLMVSYVRARAEGLGLECKIGFMQRPERVVLTCLGLLVCGITATQAKHLSFDPMLLLIIPMGFIAIFANLTAFARIAYSRKQLLKK